MRKTFRPEDKNLNLLLRTFMTQHKKPHEQDEQIDNEFKEIIEKQCPGKLYRVLRKRMKKRVVTEPQINQPKSPRNMKVFQRTFYKEQRKSTQRSKQTENTMLELKHKLGIKIRPPSPFFRINRPNILSLEKSYASLDTQRLKTEPRKKNISAVHPYIQISQSMVRSVYKRRSESSEIVTKFSPFDDIEPIFVDC